MKSSEKDSLTKILLEDIKTSANLGGRRIISWMIDTFGYRSAGRLADLLARIDEQLPESSLQETAERAVNTLADGLIVDSQGKIPAEGPLLVVANHPGLIDILGVLAVIKREDIKVVAQQKGFMHVLRNINRHMLTIEPDSTFKLSAIREIIRALNEGMAVVIFPKGQLEPDPALMDGAIESLQGWSDSIGVFLNKVPETALLPVLVSGVVTERAFNSRFAQIGWNQKRRHQLAMVRQFLAQRVSRDPAWKIPLQIDIGKPKLPAELAPDLDPRKLNLAIIEEMSSLLTKLNSNLATSSKEFLY